MRKLLPDLVNVHFSSVDGVIFFKVSVAPEIAAFVDTRQRDHNCKRAICTRPLFGVDDAVDHIGRKNVGLPLKICEYSKRKSLANTKAARRKRDALSSSTRKP